MSAPGRLTPDALRRLGQALTELTHTANRYEVRFDAYMPMNVEIDGVVLRVNWDEDANSYVVDEQFGD